MPEDSLNLIARQKYTVVGGVGHKKQIFFSALFCKKNNSNFCLIFFSSYFFTALQSNSNNEYNRNK